MTSYLASLLCFCQLYVCERCTISSPQLKPPVTALLLFTLLQASMNTLHIHRALILSSCTAFSTNIFEPLALCILHINVVHINTIIFKAGVCLSYIYHSELEAQGQNDSNRFLNELTLTSLDLLRLAESVFWLLISGCLWSANSGSAMTRH